jgi:hypothetical protein
MFIPYIITQPLGQGLYPAGQWVMVRKDFRCNRPADWKAEAFPYASRMLDVLRINP